MTTKVNKQLQNSEGLSSNEILLALMKDVSKVHASAVTSLTDSSGGTPGTVTALSVALANTANSGTSLAQKAATEAAYVTVTDALRELYAKANEYATKLGISGVTYSGGGASTDGTVGAVTVAVTAATTGVQATNLNSNHAEFNTAFYKLTVLVNRIAVALGVAELTNLTGQTFTSTVSAITTGGGTAADPGVTKAHIDAQLVIARNNVATIATKLNTFNDGVTAAAVVAV